MERCMDGREPKGSVELALDLGVSLRTLEMAFRSCMEMPPARYLRWLRLNRAHSSLSQLRPGEASVTQVAMEMGFTEFGRFAGEYRRLFGELPSETLRRGRRGVTVLLPGIG